MHTVKYAVFHWARNVIIPIQQFSIRGAKPSGELWSRILCYLNTVSCGTAGPECTSSRRPLQQRPPSCECSPHPASTERTQRCMRHNSYCASGSSTASLLTFEINCTDCPFIREYSTRCVCVLVYKCLHDAAPTYLAEMCTPVSTSVNWSHLRSATHGDLAVPRSKTEIRTTMFRSFWSHFVEHTATDRAWPITDTDSVLCALEDCTILQKFLWNTAIAPP